MGISMMNLRVRIAFCLLVFSFAGSVNGNDLQGRWFLFEEQRDNQKVALTPTVCDISKQRIRFEMTVSGQTVVREVAFTTESPASPWRLRLDNGNVLYCVPEGDRLSIYSGMKNESLSEEFQPDSNAARIVRTFRRHQSDGDDTKAESDAVSRIAEGVVIPEAILDAWQMRNPEVARDLEMEFRIRKKLKGRKQVLAKSEIEQVLALDTQRPDLHSHAIRLASDRVQTDDTQHEFIWQQTQYLRDTRADAKLVAEAESLANSLSPRVCDLDAKTLAAARQTFLAGLPIFISFAGQTPLTIDASAGIANVKLPLNYVRIPSLPAGGCRVVAKLVSQRNGKPMLLSHYTGYRPCVYSNGMLHGEFYTVGQVPLDEKSVLFVFLSSLYADEEHPAVPLSNVLSIPVVGPPKIAAVD